MLPRTDTAGRCASATGAEVAERVLVRYGPNYRTQSCNTRLRNPADPARARVAASTGKSRKEIVGTGRFARRESIASRQPTDSWRVSSNSRMTLVTGPRTGAGKKVAQVNSAPFPRRTESKPGHDSVHIRRLRSIRPVSPKAHPGPDSSAGINRRGRSTAACGSVGIARRSLLRRAWITSGGVLRRRARLHRRTPVGTAIRPSRRTCFRGAARLACPPVILTTSAESATSPSTPCAEQSGGSVGDRLAGPELATADRTLSTSPCRTRHSAHAPVEPRDAYWRRGPHANVIAESRADSVADYLNNPAARYSRSHHPVSWLPFSTTWWVDIRHLRQS
jgi:hypothetical protein